MVHPMRALRRLVGLDGETGVAGGLPGSSLHLVLSLVIGSVVPSKFDASPNHGSDWESGGRSVEKGSILQLGSERLLLSISVIAVAQTSATIATMIIHRRIVIRGNRMVKASCQF
jgi:hypothetical protein